MANKIETLKKLINELNKKSEFVQSVSQRYSKSYIYVLQHWFQKKWNIPVELIPEIILMAQEELFIQTEAKRELLVETGFVLK